MVDSQSFKVSNILLQKPSDTSEKELEEIHLELRWNPTPEASLSQYQKLIGKLKDDQKSYSYVRSVTNSNDGLPGRYYQSYNTGVYTLKARSTDLIGFKECQ